MVKTYSDEMVERWNKVIDTYLVFVGALALHDSVIDNLTHEHDLGGFVLGDPHSFQRPVVPVVAAALARPHCRFSADLTATA